MIDVCQNDPGRSLIGLSYGFSYDVHHDSFYDARTALPNMQSAQNNRTSPAKAEIQIMY